MKLFKSAELKKAYSELNKINDLSEETKALSDEQLKAKTQIFKDRIQAGETTDDLRIEAFAVAREATERVLKKRPYDVQVIGGLILDYGSVAEMRTGEGKTITSILPVYLNALSGEGVMVSTVNEYLTERDAIEMGEVHNFLGLTVGINKKDLPTNLKREAYNSDITYSVHSEIGFDYLKDNMVKTLDEKVQRGFNFALIDEVDSILVDEARTPLIITGGQQSQSKHYLATDQFVKSLSKDDYEIDWEAKSIQLVDSGTDKANKFFGIKNLFSIESSELVHRIQNALRANYIMFLDADYIVRDNKIQLVDAFTGRVMDGRSYSDGLQQAIQAKEGVEIEGETQTMATVTYQNLFRMFKKLSGMTGTGKTEEDEFLEIYNMRVNVVPTNKPVIRIDQPDYVFVTVEDKRKHIIDEIEARYKKGQPVLVGTEEVSESEKISKLLKKRNIPHTVLNAKQNESEAEIISRAGEVKAITIATNMAGRGTDIKPTREAVALGGLFVLGTNKAESRRIDNQLKGRSGRQGDPGESRFFLSLDDTLLSRFSNQDKLKETFKGFDGKAIKGRQMVRQLNRAQVKIEGFNYDSRKNVLQYDDVIRQQRDLIYAQRDIIIGHTDLIAVIQRMLSSVVKDIVNFPNFKRKDGTLNVGNLVKSLNRVWFTMVEFKLDAKKLDGLPTEDLVESITKDLLETYDLIRQRIIDNTSEEILFDLERNIVLKTFDQNWQLHIDQMTKLRSSSSLASYAQKNPYQVYVERGAELFKSLLERISHNTVRLLTQNRYAIKREAPEESAIKMAINQALKQAEVKKLIEEKLKEQQAEAGVNQPIDIKVEKVEVAKPKETAESKVKEPSKETKGNVDKKIEETEEAKVSAVEPTTANKIDNSETLDTKLDQKPKTSSKETKAKANKAKAANVPAKKITNSVSKAPIDKSIDNKSEKDLKSKGTTKKPVSTKAKPKTKDSKVPTKKTNVVQKTPKKVNTKAVTKPKVTSKKLAPTKSKSDKKEVKAPAKKSTSASKATKKAPVKKATIAEKSKPKKSNITK